MPFSDRDLAQLPGDHLFTIDETAELAGLSVPALLSAAAAGLIPPTLVGDDEIRFRHDDLLPGRFGK